MYLAIAGSTYYSIPYLNKQTPPPPRALEQSAVTLIVHVHVPHLTIHLSDTVGRFECLHMLFNGICVAFAVNIVKNSLFIHS